MQKHINRYLARYLPDAPITRENIGWFLLPVFMAAVLLLMDRYGLQTAFYRHFRDYSFTRGLDVKELAFYAQVYLSCSTVVLFVALPVAFHLLFPSGQDNPFGLRLAQTRQHLPVYLLLLSIMLPVIWLVSLTPAFHDFYPMYKPPDLEALVLYEAVYMIQFVAVEFFFRGFALFRIEQRYGASAVLIMVVPYALIHIHKPILEALASIVAALVLGQLALKSRSIWPGVLVHCGVALSMDIFALIHSGRWGNM